MMNLIELDYDWETERKRRIRYLRRQRYAKWFAIAVYALLAIGFSVAIGMLAYIGLTQERKERIAYNEGRYGVTHEKAIQMADAGIGLCAEDLLKEVRE